MPPKRKRAPPAKKEVGSLSGQLASRLHSLKALYKKQAKSLSSSYTRLLKSVPVNVRHLKVGDLLELSAEGDFDAFNGNLLNMLMGQCRMITRRNRSLYVFFTVREGTHQQSPVHRMTRSQSLCPSQTLPETPLKSSDSRRITLRGTLDSRCSILIPLEDGSVLDFDPTLPAQDLKKGIGSHQLARDQVVQQVQALQDQLSALLAGMDDD